MANKKLNALITIGGAVSGSLKGAFGSVKGNISQIGSTVADLNRKQKLLNQAINRFGENGRMVDQLRAKYAANARQIDMLTAAQKRLNNVQAAGDRNQQAKEDMRGQLGEIAAGVVAVAYPIKAAMEFEDKMAEIKKVVDAPAGMDKNTFFGQLGNQILDLSTKIPMTSSQIADLVAAGGQGGIANSDLMMFAEQAGKMGIAFDITAEKAGQSMAEMKSAFHMTLPEVVELGDKINALSNIGAASASDVMDIVQRIGPLGEVANVASGEIAALGSTLRGMGVQNEIAATGIKNLMLTLTSGSKATKGQKEALRQLGYGSKQVARSMQLDSKQTMLVILKRIKQLDSVSQPEVLNALFGKETVGSIAPLLNNIGELERQFELVADKTKYAGSMQKEFESRSATTSNQMILLRSQMNRIAITIGSTVLPVVNQLIAATFPYLDNINGLIAAHPQLVKGLVVVTAGLVAMRVAALAGGFAFTTVKGYWLAASRVLTNLDARLVRAGISWRALNLAMIASPIGLAVTAVALAVGALTLAIYRNWDVIKAFISGAITPLWEGIKPVRDAFGSIWEMVKRFGNEIGITGTNIQKAIDWFNNLFTPVKHSEDALKNATSAGQTFGTELAKAVNFVYQPLIKLVDAFKWMDANVGSIMEKAQTFGHKEIKGAWNRVKGWVMGNDPDPEAKPGWNPSYGGGTPPPAPAAMNRGGGSYTDSSTTTIQVVQQPGENQQEFARRLLEEQERRQEVKRRSFMPDMLRVP